MNPDRLVMEYMRSQRDAEDRARRDRQDVLHRQAVARRRKAKRGGKR